MEVPLDKDVVLVLADDEDEHSLMPPPLKPASRKINARKKVPASGATTATSATIINNQIEVVSSVRSTRSKRKGFPIEIKIEKPDATLESVYENAVSDDGEHVDLTFVQPSNPNKAKVVAITQASDQTMTIQPADGTFVTQNLTFTNGEPNNETFSVVMPKPAQIDSTGVLEKTTKTPNPLSIASVLTKYDSDGEIPLKVQTKKPSNQ